MPVLYALGPDFGPRYSMSLYPYLLSSGDSALVAPCAALVAHNRDGPNHLCLGSLGADFCWEWALILGTAEVSRAHLHS